jgi:UDP-N-acetylglucosamine 2-epimerase (non-hydrolysing)
MSLPPLPPKSMAVVLGTRPEIIKLGEIIRRLGEAVLLVHTGQHYDAGLSEVFFTQLGLGEPDVRLTIGGARRGRQIGDAITALDELFAERRPLAVVAQGDTNTTAAAAIAANATETPMVHVEAGLRSFDRRMPEEHNRVVADHLSDLLLAPTDTSCQNLLDEGISPSRIEITGNTVVEAVQLLLPGEGERRVVLDRFGVEPNRFVLTTFHRPENVDDADTFAAILEALGNLPLPVVLPLHPRSVARGEGFGLGSLLERLQVVEPIGYREFLALGAESALLVSDSGGVQEEVSVYKRPVIVVRRSTERPEVLGTFAERVEPGPKIGELANTWIDDLAGVHARLRLLPSPYGDGSASRRSVDAIVGMVAGG